MLEGNQIGPYHLLNQLGEGAMATVYLAEQRDPFHRLVALKVMKHAADSRVVVARFESERAALSRMSHPGVAKLFDSGVTGDGHPYFVMEYVPGIPVTEYCNQFQLTLQKRLQLFMQICEAIHHAHQKGVLHRDIKPTNILVTDQDGHPVIKVIDFGIAKATTQPLTPQTLFTEEGVLLGTPAYMSPEQAGAIAGEVDARSDVYSLGALFYELLVGVPPLDAKKLRQSAMSEMLRLVGEENPQKPYLRVAELAEAAETHARQRRTNVRALARSLRGDIEWIVMHALEKDPERRYGSASELAADVERFLTGDPVTAGPAGMGYRLRKLVSKHRVATFAAAAVFLTLVFGLIASTALYLRTEHDLERYRILERLERAAGLNAPYHELGLTEREAELIRQWVGWNRRALGDSMDFVRWIAADRYVSGYSVANKIALGRDAIRIMERAFDRGDTSVTSTFMSFPAGFLDDRASESLRSKVSDLHMRQWNDADADGRSRLVEALKYFARPHLTAKAGDPEGERLLREILSLRRVTAGSDPTALSVAIGDLTDALAARGSSLQREGKPADAVPLLREALELARELQVMRKKTIDVERDKLNERLLANSVITIKSELALALIPLKAFDEAERLLTDVYASLQGTRGIRNSATQSALLRLIDFYNGRGRTREAARYESLRPAIAVRNIRDLGSMNLKLEPPRFGGGYPILSVSVLLDSGAAWIFQHSSANAEWGSSPQGRGGVHLSNASLAGQPFLRFTEAEAIFNAERLMRDCLNEDCGSWWTLTVRSAVSDPAHQRALIFYSKEPLSPVGQRPVLAGTSLAVWRDPEASAERPEIPSENKMLFGADEPGWGSAAFSMDGMLYAYACAQVSGNDALECLLARVPLDRALDRTAWTFFAGGISWEADWHTSKPILQLTKGETISVHWNSYLQKYLALCNVDGQIRLRVADNPQGPWSESIVELDLLGGNLFQTVAVGHPELSRDGGKSVYTTFHSYNTVGAAEIELDQSR